MKKRSKRKAIAILIIITLIIAGMVGIYHHIKDIPAFRFVGRLLSPEEGGDSIRSRREKTEKPYELTNNQKYYKNLTHEDNINILVIGPDETSGNYDTLMIISLDDEKNEIKLINLPRDIYIDYSAEVKNNLEKVWSSYSSSKGIYKINAAHTLGKRINYKDGKGRFGNPEIDFTADLAEEVFGIYIDDYIFIKPSSFRKMVDYFGGVEIDVPYLMKYEDPTQNLSINIKKGVQILDGKDAEGFVRYRQGVDEKGKRRSIGDIERKKNQVAFVKAFIDQHLTLKNLGKIISIFNDMNSYITTSIEYAQEAGEYGKIAEKLYRNKFTQSSEEIECKDVNIKGVYYLEIKTSKE